MNEDMISIVRNFDPCFSASCYGLQELVYLLEDFELVALVVIWALKFGEAVDKAGAAKISK